jgi:hypothetical protein
MTYRYKLVYKTRVLSSDIRAIFVLLLRKSCKLSIHGWESVGVFLSKHFLMVSVVVFRVKMETTRSSLIVVTTYDTIKHCHKPEDNVRHLQSRDSLEFQFLKILFAILRPKSVII